MGTHEVWRWEHMRCGDGEYMRCGDGEHMRCGDENK